MNFVEFKFNLILFNLCIQFEYTGWNERWTLLNSNSISFSSTCVFKWNTQVEMKDERFEFEFNFILFNLCIQMEYTGWNERWMIWIRVQINSTKSKNERVNKMNQIEQNEIKLPLNKNNEQISMKRVPLKDKKIWLF